MTKRIHVLEVRDGIRRIDYVYHAQMSYANEVAYNHARVACNFYWLYNMDTKGVVIW